MAVVFRIRARSSEVHRSGHDSDTWTYPSVCLTPRTDDYFHFNFYTLKSTHKRLSVNIAACIFNRSQTRRDYAILVISPETRSPVLIPYRKQSTMTKISSNWFSVEIRIVHCNIKDKFIKLKIIYWSEWFHKILSVRFRSGRPFPLYIDACQVNLGSLSIKLCKTWRIVWFLLHTCKMHSRKRSI